MRHGYRITVPGTHDDQAFVARLPDRPGCIAHGATREEALANATEAVSPWLDTAREDQDTRRIVQGAGYLHSALTDCFTTLLRPPPP